MQILDDFRMAVGACGLVTVEWVLKRVLHGGRNGLRVDRRVCDGCWLKLVFSVWGSLKINRAAAS